MSKKIIFSLCLSFLLIQSSGYTADLETTYPHPYMTCFSKQEFITPLRLDFFTNDAVTAGYFREYKNSSNEWIFERDLDPNDITFDGNLLNLFQSYGTKPLVFVVNFAPDYPLKDKNAYVILGRAGYGQDTSPYSCSKIVK